MRCLVAVERGLATTRRIVKQISKSQGAGAPCSPRQIWRTAGWLGFGRHRPGNATTQTEAARARLCSVGRKCRQTRCSGQ